MSVQEEEKEIIGIKQKEREKTNLSSIEVNIDDYNDKVKPLQTFLKEKIKSHQGIVRIWLIIDKQSKLWKI